MKKVKNQSNNSQISSSNKKNNINNIQIGNISLVNFGNNMQKEKSKYINCKRHPQNAINFFCETDKIFPCSLCISAHNEHKYKAFFCFIRRMQRNEGYWKISKSG